MDGAGVKRATGVGATAVVLAVTLVAHAPSLWNDFVKIDDGVYVYENAAVRAGLTANGVRWAFGLHHPDQTYFHPLTWLSLMLDREIFGLRPWGFHLVNVVLHACVAVLLLWILLVATGRPLPAVLAALLFAVHPLTLEAVAWVTERKTVLSCAFGFGAVLAYVCARGPMTWRRNAVVTGLHLAGLLAKPGLVVLPGLLLVLDLWPLGRLRGTTGPERRATLLRLLVEKVPVTIASAAISVIVIVSTTGHKPSLDGEFPPALRIANAVVSIPRYLQDVFWPAQRAVFHPFPTSIPWTSIASSAGVIAVVTLVAVALRRRAPSLLAGWAWFCIALIPHLGFAQTGLWPSRADRFTYIPLAGMASGVVFAGAELLRRPALQLAGRAIATAAVVALLASTLVQGRHWRNSLALIGRAAEVEPNSGRMHYDLAALLMRAGRNDDARAHLETAIRVEPTFVIAHLLLGSFLAHDGDRAGAEAQYREALRVSPRNVDALLLLAELLRESGRQGEARQYYSAILEHAPPGDSAARQRAAWFAR